MNKLDLSSTDQRIFGKILANQAKDNADMNFLVTDKQQITFGEAEQITNKLAAGLQELGLKKGDRVGLFMGNQPEMVLLALAINKISAIWMPISIDYKGDWLAESLSRGELSFVITDAIYQQRIVDVQHQFSVEKSILIGDAAHSELRNVYSYQSLLEHGEFSSDYADQHYGDVCAILWTSGTTGRSKGVMQSYNSWLRAIINGGSPQYNSQPGDSIYCVLPLYNSGAWIICILRALVEGIPCVIEAKFSVSTFWERIKHFGATQTFAIGAMGTFLMNSPEKPDDAETPLRVAQIVPMPPNLWGKFEERFNVSLIRTGLGMSECLLIFTQLENREDIPVYALGFPPEDIEVKLLDDQQQEVELGQVGEIAILPKEPFSIFSGYFKDEEATKKSFAGDWFLSGDLARQDPKTGAYFYADRKKDAVRFAGRNISTLEVESVVRRHPAVQDVAAFGITAKEEATEQELKLDVVLQSVITHEELCEFINENAPHYFVPRYIDFVDSLPYTPTNKIQKYLLRDKGVTETTWDLKNSSYVVKK